MLFLLGGQKLKEEFSRMTKQVAECEKKIEQCRKTISSLQERIKELENAVAESVNNPVFQNRQTANEPPVKKEKAEEPEVFNDKTVKIVRNGFFDLNRSDVFVELCTSKSAKSAFAVFPAEAEDCVEFEICNLPRLISYDGIGDAVDFSSGSCMLASASGCKTVERGMARMEEDGFWHIIKRSQVLLYK